MKVWDIVVREPWMNVLPLVWAFCCKHYPDGSVRKLKAPLCAGGHQQIEGVDFFETFAPVVNWQTVCTILILSIILNLATMQVNYTAAFVHAMVDTEVFVKMPRGFAEAGKVLRLNKSLYGLQQSPQNFFQHLKSKLEQPHIGFRQSESDSCLFISDKVLCLVYVDNTLFFSPIQGVY